MKKLLPYAFIVLLALVYWVVIHQPSKQFAATTNIAIPQDLLSSFFIYPDHKVTPGKADTLSANDLTKSYSGLTYSQYHRNVPEREKKQVLAEYGNPTGTVEIDHFYPLCAGGSNDITNLWPEPEHVMVNGEDLGFHTKDKLEAEVCREIKNGTLLPKEAYSQITNDWVAFYHKLVKPTYGSIYQFTDDEDDIQE